METLDVAATALLNEIFPPRRKPNSEPPLPAELDAPRAQSKTELAHDLEREKVVTQSEPPPL